jgi:hypothetical protein
VLGRTIGWGEVARAQSDLLCASFERLNRLGSLYVEILEAMTAAMAWPGSNHGRKAA